jgi:hypothetical protein
MGLVLEATPLGNESKEYRERAKFTEFHAAASVEDNILSHLRM